MSFFSYKENKGAQTFDGYRFPVEYIWIWATPQREAWFTECKNNKENREKKERSTKYKKGKKKRERNDKNKKDIVFRVEGRQMIACLNK